MTETRLGKLFDWWLERIMMSPFNLASGRHVTFRVLALVVYLPWIVITLPITTLLLFAALFSEVGGDMWDEMRPMPNYKNVPLNRVLREGERPCVRCGSGRADHVNRTHPFITKLDPPPAQET